MELDEVKTKIKTGLGLFDIEDDFINRQIDQHIASAIHRLGQIEGIDNDVLFSDSGLMLLIFHVNDTWRNGGQQEFSPATIDIFRALDDEMMRKKHANDNPS